MAKDYTKYNVEGIDGEFNKARLAQAIVKHYVENNAMLWETILVTFPLELQGKKGVISKKSEVEKERDFYVDAPMKLQDGTEIVTCRQWGKHNLVHFIERATALGYEISVVGGETEAKEESTLKFTTEQIEKIGKATRFYDIDQDYFSNFYTHIKYTQDHTHKHNCIMLGFWRYHSRTHNLLWLWVFYFI